jgi:serine/threonine-protein kinase
VVLYEMLSGRRPFRADTVPETLAEVLKADLDWSAIPAGTPASIVQLLHRCLERDPKERLRDIGEARVQIQRQIQQMTSGVASADAPSTPHHAPVVAGRRGSIFWIAAGLAAVVAVAAAAIWLNHLISPAREARSFQIASGPNTSAARIAPNGRAVVYVDDGHLVVRDNIESLEKRVLEGTPGRVARPFWSPDSASIGYFINNTVHVIPAAGGPDRLMTSNAFAAMGAAWCDSGIVVTHFGRGLWLLADGGDKQLAQVNTAADERFVLEPACLPHGRLLAIVVMKGEIRNYVAVVDGINRIPLTAITDEKKQSLVFVPPDRLLYVQSTPNPGIYALPVARDLSRALGPAVPVLAADVVPPVSVSTDGTLVAMSGVQTTEEQLVWVDRNGKKQRSFGRPQTVHFLAASPDGRHVAITTGNEDATPGIFIHQDATSQRMTSARGDGTPSWSPTGDRVAYISGADRSLWVRPIASTNAALVVKGPVRSAEWSADGMSVIYNTGAAGQRGLWIAAISGTHEPRRLQGEGGAGALSSDGHFRAYTSATAGPSDVYVTTFPTPGNATPVSIDGGRNPRWGPGTNELFYAGGPSATADSISRRDLYAVTIDAHGDVKAGSRTKLFDASALGLALDHQGSRTYDVGPGGQSFIVRTTGQSGEPVIIAIQNLAAWMRIPH